MDHPLLGRIDNFGDCPVYRRLGTSIPIEAERHYFLMMEGFDIDGHDLKMEHSKEWSPIWRSIKSKINSGEYEGMRLIT